MRREDKEIKDNKLMESILQEADHCVIALSEDKSPYIVPMNFGYKDCKLYLHSSAEGRKIKILKANNRVSFGVEIKTKLLKDDNPCNWGMRYISVIGFGQARFIEDFNKKIDAMNIIMNKYADDDPETPESFEYSKTSLNQIVVIEVEITKLTGKISGY